MFLVEAGHGYDDEAVRVVRRICAVVGLMACLGPLTCACTARRPPANVPPPATAPQPPQAPPSAAPPAESIPLPAPPPVTTTPRPDTTSLDCALIPETGGAIATVALAERIDPAHAPRPANESEQLLFRQIYETLIRIDCKGRLHPGLAESWSLDKDGRTWIVAIRENARFSDGTAVTAAAVRGAWMRDLDGNELQPLVGRLIETVVPVDNRTLAITLRRSRPDQPRVLAHTDLAIARTVVGSRWPLGTRLDGATLERDPSDPSASSTISIRRDNLPSIRFLVAAGDQRDLLDKGPDLLLTRDHAALEYAATLPQFATVPLEWRTVHVLVTPGRARGTATLTPEARQALATDAVRGEARG